MSTKLEVHPPAKGVSGQRGNMPGYATERVQQEFTVLKSSDKTITVIGTNTYSKSTLTYCLFN